MQRGFLVDLATDVVKLLGSLSPIPPVDDVGLRQRFLDLLAEFHARGVRAGYSGELMDAARFALVALIDERVLALNTSIAVAWKKATLHHHLFAQSDANHGFFERLAALRPPSSAERADAADVFHLCLCLGFRGRFHDASQDVERQALIADVAHDILAARGGVNAPLSPAWEPRGGPPPMPHPGRWHGVPVWAVPVVLGVVSLLCWLATTLWTNAVLARFANDFPVR